MPSHYDIDWSLYDKADKETLRRHTIASAAILSVGMLLVVLLYVFSIKNETGTGMDNTDSTVIADTVRKSISDTITIKQR